ncbi:phosphatidylinositol 4-phosphatase, partial [Phenoliferia sp. Uapishka_3]
MPATHRRLAVHLTPDGLVVRPRETSGGSSPYRGNAVLVGWGRDTQPKEMSDWEEEGEFTVDCEGIAGFLTGFHGSYLILITDASVVATLFDPSRAIHTVDGLLSVPLDLVTARPLLAKHAAKQASRRSSSKAEAEADTTDGDDSSTETDIASLSDAGTGRDSEASPEADESPIILPKDPNATVKARRSFWKRSPFAGSSASTASVASSATTESKDLSETIPALVTAPDSPASKETVASQIELDTKIVHECARELKGMYFSHTFDITRSIQHKHELASGTMSPNNKEAPAFLEPSSHLPLWRRADRRFWWNAHLMAPFVEAGQLHAYIVVLVQGFVQHTSISLPIQTYSTLDHPTTPVDPSPPVNLELIIISRRSVERPGLRYQRRGANVSGQVANFVETELIVGSERDSKLHVSSFVQTRGSIPVFWSQSPWNLKPPPVLERTPQESQVALGKHFEKQVKEYGRQVIVNLAEQHGKEATVVGAYRDGVAALARDDVKYVEWDFHQQTKGMKYENIAKLSGQLESDLEDMSCFWAADQQVFSTQSGVVRTNCIDCLDRTNVVQSAISRWMLNRHLVHLGLSSQEEAGMHDDLDKAFMAIWADNGDAISREYAGTSALKGDFTRTGKRNFRGALNDASNSVARLLQSTVTDFFKQAVIDYCTGANLAAFAEFQEKLSTSDPGDILRLAQIRLEAIETSAKSVLTEDEERIAAWTLLGPVEQDCVRSTKYEEKVLLLSSKAIYVVSYEYTLQKVRLLFLRSADLLTRPSQVTSFTRIPTGDVVGIQQGAYILSALDAAGRDEVENYGFLLSFQSHSTTSRVHSYSMRSKPPSPNLSSRASSFVSSSKASSISDAHDGEGEAATHYFAFKALRRDMIRLGSDGQSQIIEKREEAGGKTAKATVEGVVARLREECEKIGAVEDGDEGWAVIKDLIGCVLSLNIQESYGDYNTTCTEETFTPDNLESTYPGSTEEPWTILETFGPTESGCEGFVASIAVGFSGSLRRAEGSLLSGCKTVDEQGHAGMGAPRTFNAAGATYYNSLYGGKDVAAAYWLTERSVSNGDAFVNMFPQSDDYTFTETAFLWYGVNATFKMNRVVCEGDAEDADCMPLTPTSDNDHYFYFDNVRTLPPNIEQPITKLGASSKVGSCGKDIYQNNTIIEAYIASQQAAATGTESAAIAAETSVVVSSSAVVSSASSTASAALASDVAAVTSTASVSSPTSIKASGATSSSKAGLIGIGFALLLSTAL